MAGLPDGAALEGLGRFRQQRPHFRHFIGPDAKGVTDAVNIFIQQSLNMEGLPFLASPENAEYMKAKAMRRLLDEAEKGWKSAEKDGWVSEEDAYRTLGVTE